uniref:Uncharacterized protein n=1 Tax=Oryza sativa subsp. japonica TaxID=39947 RepID=Q6ZBS4_ORYSJ|nr:hypothetical protein [Oryza sativa Japonica Group]BAD03239.1 hypothetical protein [Oryza sativa Japonica Group]
MRQEQVAWSNGGGGDIRNGALGRHQHRRGDLYKAKLEETLKVAMLEEDPRGARHDGVGSSASCE